MNITANGLVLSEVAVRDNDKILTILMEGIGKISAGARGAKRMKSPLMPIAQPFVYASFNLYSKGEKYYIDGGEQLASFYELRGDLVKLALASYVTELARIVTEENNPDDEVLRLSLNTLYALCKLKKEPALIKAAFELRLMSICGYLPELSGCAACGREQGPFCFDFAECGLLCQACAPHAVGPLGSAPLSEGTLAAMRYVLAAPANRVFSFQLDARGIAEMGVITERYLIQQIDREPRALTFYRQYTL